MNDTPIDFETLLLELPGDKPAGDESAYGYHLRSEINELRREELPSDFDDATRPEELKKSDWEGIVTLCTEALQHEAKDLRVACHLLEALVKLRGFQGLEDGLTLLNKMLVECWDRLVPALEDNDCEERSVLLANMLDDQDRGILFPHVVRSAPLFGTEENRYGLADWKRAGHLAASVEKEEIQRALEVTPSDWIETVYSSVESSQQHLAELMQVLDARMGEVGPSLTNLRSAVSECQQFIRECLKHHPPAAEQQPNPEDQDGSAKTRGESAEASPLADISNRLEAYAQLARAADALAKIEPHSPTPYLVRRAIELGRLPFPQWIASLMREETVLADLMRGVEHSEAV